MIELRKKDFNLRIIYLGKVYLAGSEYYSLLDTSDRPVLHIHSHLHLKDLVIEHLLLIVDNFNVPLDIVTKVLLEVIEILLVLVNQVGISTLPLQKMLVHAVLVRQDVSVKLIR